MENKSDYTVLIVDDIPQNLQVLGNTLIDSDLNSIAALNGEDALEIVEETPVDLILLDISMPGMDGFEVCRRIKADPATEEIPIIFLTAMNQSEDIVKGFELGAVDYITKPFNSAELLKRISTHLKLKHSQDTIKEQYKELKQRNKEVTSLLAGANAILTSETFEIAAQKIFNACKKLTGAKAGYIALLNDKKNDNEIVFIDEGNMDCNVDPELPMPIRGLRKVAYDKGKTVYDNDYLNSEHQKYMPEGHIPLKNALFAPLIVYGEAIGLLGVGDKDGNFTKNDVKIATAFAEYAAIALVNARNIEKLNREREQLLSILDSIPEPIYISDKETYKVLFANKTLKETFSKDVIGKLCYQAIQNNQAPCSFCTNSKIFNSDQPCFWQHFNPVAKKHFYMIDRAIKWTDGRDARFQLAIDITEQKKAEELSNKVKVAQNSAKLKQKFLANISHEMRTPLNGIIGMTDLVSETKLSGKQQEFINSIKVSSQSLLHIINDVLSYSKIDQGQAESIAESTNIHELVKNTVSDFNSQALSKKIDLSFSIEKAFPEYLLLDKRHTRQILYNLVSNAIKFTDKGYVKIKLKTIKKEGKRIKGRITVKDTGIGIKKEYREKIFDPFVRLDDSLTRTTEGTGMGLPLTKKLVELMDGKIELESKEGNGTTFCFTFEAEVLENKKGQKENQNKASQKLNLKILLAEDKLLNQKVATMLLENQGCKVDIAQNGKEVLEKYEKDKYDIILMDIMMPEMDGITAMNKLKENYKELPPVIGLSAHAMEGDAQKYIAKGMDDYIEKPINKDKLISKLRKWGKVVG